MPPYPKHPFLNSSLIREFEFRHSLFILSRAPQEFARASPSSPIATAPNTPT